jgi:hypothetical protein
MLAAMLEREDAAARYFEQAIAMNERMGATPWVARPRVEYAAFLLHLERSPSLTDALLAQASAEAARLGMAPLLERANELTASRAT